VIEQPIPGQQAKRLQSKTPDLTLLVVGILLLQVVLQAALLVRTNRVYRWIAEDKAVANSSTTDISLVSGVSPDDDPFLGPASAPVTIVEFSDFGCSHCREVQQTLAQVRQRYGDQVRIVFRDFSLEGPGSASFTAALGAECASDQGAFWAMHDLLFEKQPAFDMASVQGYAASLGLDMDQFRPCMVLRQHEEDIMHDHADGVSYGVSSTPTFFVNGHRLVGAVSLSVFRRAVDESLRGR